MPFVSSELVFYRLSSFVKILSCAEKQTKKGRNFNHMRRQALARNPGHLQ